MRVSGAGYLGVTWQCGEGRSRWGALCEAPYSLLTTGCQESPVWEAIPGSPSSVLSLFALSHRYRQAEIGSKRQIRHRCARNGCLVHDKRTVVASVSRERGLYCTNGMGVVFVLGGDRNALQRWFETARYF